MNSAVCRSTAPRFSATAIASLGYSEDGSDLTAVLCQRQLSAIESEVLAVGFGSGAGTGGVLLIGPTMAIPPVTTPFAIELFTTQSFLVELSGTKCGDLDAKLRSRLTLALQQLAPTRSST